MNKNFMFGIFLIPVLALAAVHRNTAIGYEAPVPAAWTKVNYPFPNTDFWAPEVGKNVSFKVVKTATPLSLNDYAAQMKKSHDLAKGKDWTSKSATLAGQPALRLRSTLKENMVSTNYLVRMNGAIYDVSLFGNPDASAKYEPEFEKIAAAFRFVK